MDETNFCYWLKGFFELTDSNKLSEAQVKMIKEHLNLVFNKVTQPLQPEFQQPHTGLLDPDIRKAIDTITKDIEEKQKKLKIPNYDIICSSGLKYC